MANVTFVPNYAVQAYEFKTTNGMVGRDFRRRGILLQSYARRQVGKKTGFTALSIGYSVKSTPRGVVLTVGSSSRVALIHHNGTRPHVIRPKQMGGTLRFNSGGRIIYAKRVMHPGTRANRYLTDNLPKVVLR